MKSSKIFASVRAQDPLAIIGILGIFFPFILLGIAIATGYVDVSNYRQAVVIASLGQRFVMTGVMAICSACGDAADLQPAGCRAAATRSGCPVDHASGSQLHLYLMVQVRWALMQR